MKPFSPHSQIQWLCGGTDERRIRARRNRARPVNTMNRFQKEYQEKLCSQAEVYQHIQDGDYIGSGFAGCEPIAFFKGLHTIADRVSNIRISHSLEMLPYEFQKKPYCEKFRAESFFLMGPGREAMQRGAEDYIPGNLHHAPGRQIESHPFDVFVCAVTPMDEMGYSDRFRQHYLQSHRWVTEQNRHQPLCGR